MFAVYVTYDMDKSISTMLSLTMNTKTKLNRSCFLTQQQLLYRIVRDTIYKWKSCFYRLKAIIQEVAKNYRAHFHRYTLKVFPDLYNSCNCTFLPQMPSILNNVSKGFFCYYYCDQGIHLQFLM